MVLIHRSSWGHTMVNFKKKYPWIFNGSSKFWSNLLSSFTNTHFYRMVASIDISRSPSGASCSSIASVSSPMMAGIAVDIYCRYICCRYVLKRDTSHYHITTKSTPPPPPTGNRTEQQTQYSGWSTELRHRFSFGQGAKNRDWKTDRGDWKAATVNTSRHPGKKN
jgi:hypothetical protein